ncbi:MAG: rhomboid family intramembrane serine protease [Cellvibrionaceae bacterium]|nr:rhomboid family intramembrane serine protease [Cellvibrionaceae bacterium]
MIIIPTEKRLDWRRPPLAVLGLLLLNLAVFGLYQSADSGKFERAYQLYSQHQFVDFEAAAYLDYRKQNGILQSDPELYRELSQIYDNEPAELASTIMLDLNFSAHLATQQAQWIPKQKRDDWQQYRPLVDQQIATLSSISLGLIPEQMSLVTLLSHQFLHGGIMHLLGNMVFLLICGFAVEAALGSLRFLLFYMISGVGAGLLFALLELWANRGGVPLVGASGAISGVMAMYLALFRLRRIEFFYWVLIFIGYFRAPALLILPIYLGKELLYWLGDDNANIAYMAHIGGFIGGAALVGLTLWQKPEAIDEDYLQEDQSIDPRRESLAAVLEQIEATQFASALKKLDAHQQQFGACQQLKFMRANLLQLSGGEAWLQACQEVLLSNGREPELARNQLRLWQRLDGEQRQLLDQQQRSQLALRWLAAELPDSAEAIALELIKAKSQTAMLSKLLGQLANFYRDCDNPRKQEFFEQALSAALARQ